jgi:hypothetical protein
MYMQVLETGGEKISGTMMLVRCGRQRCIKRLRLSCHPTILVYHYAGLPMTDIRDVAIGIGTGDSTGDFGY